MKVSLVEHGVPAAIGVVGLAILGLWVRSYYRDPGVLVRPLSTPTTPSAQPRAAGPSGQPLASLPASTTGGTATNVPLLPGEWPGFRGAAHDNVSHESVALSTDWGQLRPLWSIDLGEGYAGAAVKSGRVYVLDYDPAGQQDLLRCYSLTDGKELWRTGYHAIVKRNHGMSRTIPAVTDKYVVSLGPKCDLMCCDALSGKQIWRMNLVDEYGATVPDWYAGQCPFIDGDKLIVAPGGKALVVALDLATGRVAWRSPNPRGWKMTHSSIASMDLGGQKCYVYCGTGGVAGVSAKDGSILWDTTDWVVSTATVPSPVPIGDGRIFLSGGYNAGCMMLKVEGSGSRFTAKTLYKLPSSTFGSDQQSPILFGGSIYGITPSGELVCLSLDGKGLWTSRRSYRFGLGPYLIADGKLLALSEGGTLTMAEASPTAFKQLAQAKVLDGKECWGPMAIAGGRLIARDVTHMVCLDLARH